MLQAAGRLSRRHISCIIVGPVKMEGSSRVWAIVSPALLCTV